ncbi:MAG: MMPL family transporter, partial [Myxococcales bacterium]|nr:MMPL family transporter [Myxococcales bacterium]
MTRAERYVEFLVRRWATLLAIGVVAFGASVWLVAYHLPLHADFSNLLPADAPSVRDLRRLEDRVPARDKLLVLVVAADPTARAVAAAEISRRARTLPLELVGRVEDDDAVARDYLRAHRHLFVPLADLEAARDALAVRIRTAKLATNPLFIDLDPPSDDEAASSQARLDDLRSRQREAEAKLGRSGFVSPDEKTQLIVLDTGFPKTDVHGCERLIETLDEIRTQVAADHGVEIGFAGGPVVTLAEHSALVRGMLSSGVATALLVGIVLIAYLRSARLIALLGFILAGSTTLAFGLAVFTVGHLNAATAFLGAIIAGNGVNYGILLIARFREERMDHAPRSAMASAIATTLRPTLVASLAAAVAYGSLAVTSFRGFSDFALIGAVGMLVCWVASYTLLPALILRCASGPFPTRRLRLGPALAITFGFRRPRRVLAAVAVVSLGAATVTTIYLAHDPFEYDTTRLRSAGTDAVRARSWMARSDAAFGRGITGQTFIAADNLADIPAIVDGLHHVDRPGQRPTIGTVRSLLDVVPPDQPAKLVVLDEIRTMLDDAALAALTDDERADLAMLRPPADLAPITLDGLPEPLAAVLRERDGRLGLLISVRPHPSIDEWDGR